MVPPPPPKAPPTKVCESLDSNMDVDTREQYVQCLKELLIKVGIRFKKSNIESYNNNVIKKIKENSESNKFSFREKFMFIDLLELNTKWENST